MSRPVVSCAKSTNTVMVDGGTREARLQCWYIEINGKRVGTFSYNKVLLKFVAEWLGENLPDAIKAAKGG